MSRKSACSVSMASTPGGLGGDQDQRADHLVHEEEFAGVVTVGSRRRARRRGLRRPSSSRRGAAAASGNPAATARRSAFRWRRGGARSTAGAGPAWVSSVIRCASRVSRSCGPVGLGDHEAGRRAGDDSFHVGDEIGRADRIDPHPDRGAMLFLQEFAGEAAGAATVLRRDGILQIEDQRIGRRGFRLGELLLGIAGHEEEGAEDHVRSGPWRRCRAFPPQRAGACRESRAQSQASAATMPANAHLHNLSPIPEVGNDQ